MAAFTDVYSGDFHVFFPSSAHPNGASHSLKLFIIAGLSEFACAGGEDHYPQIQKAADI